MKKRLSHAVFCGLVAVLGLSDPSGNVRGWTAEPAAGLGKRVLLVTGEDHPAHKWPETSPVVKSLLAKDSRLHVTVLDDLTLLDKTELERYDAVVLHFKNYKPQVPGPQTHANLEAFVRRGGGLVLIHFACGAFQEWPQFVQIAGRVWNPKFRGHDPRGPFRVDIAAAAHPITQGLKPFEPTDELYTCLDGDVPITVLATAVSKVDRKTYPMAFVLDCGKGRTFQLVLGHDVQAFRPPEVGELLRRGTAWTLRLKPIAAGLQ